MRKSCQFASIPRRYQIGRYLKGPSWYSDGARHGRSTARDRVVDQRRCTIITTLYYDGLPIAQVVSAVQGSKQGAKIHFKRAQAWSSNAPLESKKRTIRTTVKHVQRSNIRKCLPHAKKLCQNVGDGTWRWYGELILTMSRATIHTTLTRGPRRHYGFWLRTKHMFTYLVSAPVVTV